MLARNPKPIAFKEHVRNSSYRGQLWWGFPSIVSTGVYASDNTPAEDSHPLPHISYSSPSRTTVWYHLSYLSGNSMTLWTGWLE